MNLLRLKADKVGSKAKRLSENLGGKWRYDGRATWWCDDGVRHVSRVSMGYGDEEGPFGYHLYGGENPGWLYFL